MSEQKNEYRPMGNPPKSIADFLGPIPIARQCRKCGKWFESPAFIACGKEFECEDCRNGIDPETK